MRRLLRHCRRFVVASRSRRRGGRALAVAVAIAAALIGIAAILVWLMQTGDGEPIDPGVPIAAHPDPEAPKGDAPAGDSARARSAATPGAAASGAPPEESSAAPPPADGPVRISGTVRDRAGRPISGAFLRWIPAELDQVQRRAHDAAAVGPDASEAAWPPALATAFALSRTAASDERGIFELRVARTEPEGVVAAADPRYEMALREVRAEALAASAGEPPTPEASDPEASDPEASDPEASDPAADTSARASVAWVAGVHFQLAANPASVRGRVTDAESGEPVPGMVVSADPIKRGGLAIFALAKVDAPETVVRDDGRYSLDGLRPGEYRVGVLSGDSDHVGVPSSQGEKVVLAESALVEGVDFAVARGFRISGRVVDATGDGIAGAECRIHPADAFEASSSGDVELLAVLEKLEQTSDDEGRFVFRALPRAKSYRVVAKSDGFAPAIEGPIGMEGDTAEIAIEIVLAPGWTIAGRVLYADSSPVAGIEVSAFPDFDRIAAMDPFTSELLRFGAETDELGGFRIVGVPRGTYSLLAGSMQHPAVLSQSSERTKTVTVRDRDVEGVELIIPERALARVSGRIIDDEGHAVVHATVRVSATDDFVASGAVSVLSEARGTFRVAELSGAEFEITAEKEGHATTVLRPVAAGADGLEIILPRFGRVTGIVRAKSGLPIGGSGNVHYVAGEGESAISRMRDRLLKRATDISVPLAADGSFEIEVPPGVARLRAEVPGFAPGISAAFMLAAGGEKRGVEIELSEGASLSGVVRLRDGTELAGATVHLRAKSGDNAGDMMARMMPQLFGDSSDDATSDAAGRFAVRHLEPGDYEIFASHVDYAPSDTADVHVAPDQHREVAPLILSRGASLRGTVSLRGERLSGVMVQLVGDAPFRQATSKDDGSFEFAALRPGDYLLIVTRFESLTQFKIKQRTVTVVDGADNACDIVFGIGTRVRGSVAGVRESPFRPVTLRRPGGPAPEDVDMTDPAAMVESGKYQAGIAMISKGEYLIEDVEPGIYILELHPVSDDPFDFESYASMDRTPLWRKEIRVQKEDVDQDIIVEGGGAR